MYLRKERAGSAPGHEWPHDGAVIEVRDDLAEQLIRIPGGGFSVAPAPTAEDEPVETTEEFDEQFDAGEPVEPEEPKKSPGRPKLPRDAKGNIIRN